MSKYWSEKILKIEPYVPGEQPIGRKYIKLNTNENPYPPSGQVLEAIKAKTDETLKLYPDPICRDLSKSIADYYKVPEEMVFIGNGSDEILAFSFLAFFNPGDEIVFADITYSFYEVYADFFGVRYRLVSLDDDFNMPISDYYEKNDGVIIANPNAPTGRAISLCDIRNILEKNTEKVVIVDEAYIDFGGQSSVELISKYPNLLVIQTFSKSRSLAGIRVGFALGHEDLIAGLNRVKNSVNSYTIDRLALAGAEASIRDTAYFEETRNKVIKTRECVTARLKEMDFKVIDSKANFIFISHGKVPAASILARLREVGILVRYFNRPRIDNYLRVSIGTDEEMEIFCSEVRKIVC